MRPDTFKAILADAGLRQRKLAAVLGVTSNTVNRWARGLVPVPRYAVAFLAVYSRLDAATRRWVLEQIEAMAGEGDG